jgi:hypothetical protein
MVLSKNPTRLGESKPPSKNRYFTAFILMKAEGNAEETIKELKTYGIKEAYPLTGEYQIIARVEAQTEELIEDILKHKIKQIDSIKGTITLNVQAPEIISRDLESRIERMISETGIVKPKYGGYEIQVVNETVFPWSALFKVLLEYSMEVWITQKDETIIISCKPPSL